MNVRKPVDYSVMFAALDALMAADLPQIELYCEIGQLVSGWLEKGAAVATAEYLCGVYHNASGFFPRNLRWIREFYRTHKNNPEILDTGQGHDYWLDAECSYSGGGTDLPGAGMVYPGV